MAFKPTGGGSPKYVLGVDRFKGVDLAGNPTSKSQARADFALNMITDGNGYPETRHGYEKVIGAEGRINGIYSLQTLAGDKTLVHHGTKLSEWANGTLTELYAAMADEKSTATQMENKLIILDGKAALVYANWGDEMEAKWGVKLMSEVAYAPTTVIGAVPGAIPGGTAYENVNLIGDYQYNQFVVATAVEQNGVLQLSDAPVSDVSVQKLNNSGIWDAVTSGYTVNAATGTLTFSAGLTATPVTGRDNYRVKFKSSHTFNESVSQDWSSPVKGTMHFATVDGKRQPSTSIWATPEEMAVLRGQGYSSSYTCPYYKFRFRYPTIEFSKPIYFTISNATPNSSTDQKAVRRTYELSNIGVGKLSRYDAVGIWMYSRETSSGDVYDTYLRYWIEQDGTDYYLYIVQDDMNIWWAGYDIDRIYGNTTFVLIDGNISYTRITAAYPDRVNYCTVLQKYGYGGNADRLFISGNPALPNYDFWSGIGDPTYFPDLNYAQIGDENTAIMGYSWLSDGSLAIHKEWDGEDSTIYIRKGDTFNGQVVFTLTQGAVGLGVVSSRCGGYMNGDPLQLSSEGVFATIPVGNTAINERYAQNRSYFVNPLLKKQNLKEAEAIVHKGKYYLAAGDYVFVADGDQRRYS